MMLLSTIDWKAMRFTLLALAVPCALAAQTPTLPIARLQEDLEWFRTNVLAVEKSYSPSARAAAERRLIALEASLDRTSTIAFGLELARIAALADNGHSNAFAGSRSRWSNRVPLRLTTFGNEFRVMKAIASHTDLLGAKLTAIDGMPIAAVRDSGRTLFGGTPTWRDRNLPLFLESPDQLHALGIARDSRAAEYTFQTEAGRTIKRRISADMSGVGGPPPDLLLYAQPDPAFTIVTPVTMPWSLQEPFTVFRSRRAPEIDGLVIQLRRIVDGPGQPILEFLEQMKATIAAERPRNVVLDLRMNSGGNLNNARDFVKALPTLVPGRIFVVTGPGTFSAAISTTGYLKQESPGRVSIVGEEAGDRLVFFAEGRPATAPNTGIMIGVATQRHDYQGGCKAFTDCHPPVIRSPIAVPTLAPDIPAPLTWTDWKAGRDPAMEAITRALKPPA
jgi:hypothetical protein